MVFETFADFETYLDELGLFSMQLGLSRMHTSLARLDLTQTPATVVQVVGTNGKGSTSGFLAALAKSHGLQVGLYQSPHLVSVRERIRINGYFVPEHTWLEAANTVLARCADLGLTYFELLTVMALQIFSTARLDLVILEAGLGGTHDATCAIPADFVIITPIGLDHEAVLGPTLADIARDKAGALGRCPAVLGLQDPQAEAILRQAAGQRPLFSLTEPGVADRYAFRMTSSPQSLLLSPSLLPAHPLYQVENAALALWAWKHLAEQCHWSFEASLCIKTLAQTRFAGRFCRHGQVLVDGAHNTQGLTALCAALEARKESFDLLVFQAMMDKILDRAVLDRLKSLARRTVIPALPGLERARDATDLATWLGPDVSIAQNLETALAQTTGTVLLCGSLYLAGAYYALHPEYVLL